MTATNHALTGALIGLTVHNPWIALPAALVSHLVCDTLPHFGSSDRGWIKGKRFAQYLAVDALLCVVLVAVLFVRQPADWLLAAVCAFVATSPDLLSIPKFLAARAGRQFHPNGLVRFLENIQWFERPIGVAVEAAWFLAAVFVLAIII